MADYFREMFESLKQTAEGLIQAKALDSRYNDLKTGRVTASDGEEAFRRLREKSERRQL